MSFRTRWSLKRIARWVSVRTMPTPQNSRINRLIRRRKYPHRHRLRQALILRINNKMTKTSLTRWTSPSKNVLCPMATPSSPSHKQVKRLCKLMALQRNLRQPWVTQTLLAFSPQILKPQGVPLAVAQIRRKVIGEMAGRPLRRLNPTQTSQKAKIMPQKTPPLIMKRQILMSPYHQRNHRNWLLICLLSSNKPPISNN